MLYRDHYLNNILIIVSEASTSCCSDSTGNSTLHKEIGPSSPLYWLDGEPGSTAATWASRGGQGCVCDQLFPHLQIMLFWAEYPLDLNVV